MHKHFNIYIIWHNEDSQQRATICGQCIGVIRVYLYINLLKQQILYRKTAHSLSTVV